MKLKSKYIEIFKAILIINILKLNQNLKMNLILIKELYQENVLLLKNVKVNLIIIIMQLNQYKDNKDKLILMNYKLDNKLNK